MRTLPALIFAACSGAAAPPVQPEGEHPIAVEVRPADVEVVTSPGGAAPLVFEAWATYADGEPERVDVVQWSLSNRSAGALDTDGAFVASTTNGGEALVTATLDGVSGTAALHVVFEDALNPDGVDTSLFSGPRLPPLVDDGGAPLTAWLYPPDRVVVPRNAPALHFMWQDQGALAYRLSFRSPTTRIDVYTPRPEYVADEAMWARTAATNAGGDVSVELSAALPDGVRTEKGRQVHVNRLDAFGSIIYWSTSRSGLVEIPYGLPARDFLTPAETGHCVACHAVSRDGRVAFTYDGGNGALGVKSIADRADIVGPDSGQAGNFHTFSPDGQLLVTASHGDLRLIDATTGAALGDVLTTGDATHPDWSPTDDALVFVRARSHIEDWILGGSTSLLMMDHLGGGSFGAPRLLVESDADHRLYYPSFSPDGAWVAYNRSTGDTYDDPDAELWVVAADGSSPPIRLDAANDVGPLTNSWPRWGPLPDDDVLWLTFASKRPYGFLTSGNPQIWMTAFDPTRAASGLDPSSPAAWLPNQDVTTNNHIPVWTE
ncbi:MAG TPA: hypothetical protein PKA64_16275 [Myxococcota bacterium]|nr:hypothetical protein [Myxococcota bacterium]